MRLSPPGVGPGLVPTYDRRGNRKILPPRGRPRVIGGTMLTDAHRLEPIPLRDLALTMAQRDHVEHHWSVQAIVLGRVQDEGLFKTEPFYDPRGEPYTTARVWAFELLHVPTERFRVLVEKFWPMMKRCRAEISFDAWAAVPQTRALLLVKVLALPGVSAMPWFHAAADAPSTAAFRRQVGRLLQEPEWTTWRCRVPVSLVEPIEYALALALPRVLGTPHPDPERAKDKDVRFRLLEHIVVLYSQLAHRDVASPPADPALTIASMTSKLDENEKSALGWLIRSARDVGFMDDDAEQP